MAPKVYNRKTDVGLIEEPSVYVGRPSKWGNPFVVGVDGTREEVVQKYLDHFVGSTPDRSEAAIKEELVGVNLVCWCAPKLCHADVLMEIANGGGAASSG